MREAVCQCGELALVCRGEPVVVSVCHCLDCQRRTGSAFGIGAFFGRDQVAIARGAWRRFERQGESGSAVASYFCPECGSTVWWEAERLPSMTGVAVGAFADPDFPAPTQASWDVRRHPWVRLPDGMVCHAQSARRVPSAG